MEHLSKLSKGCLKDVLLERSSVEKPILQICGIKAVNSTTENSNSVRHRILLSDGTYLYSYAMLGTQLQHLVENGTIAPYCIIKLNRSIITLVKRGNQAERRVLIIIELDVVVPASTVGCQLGNPEMISDTLEEDVTSNKENKAGTSDLPVGNASSNAANQSMDTSIFNPALTHPIASLSPYQNKWVIKVRVTSKSPIRKWSNDKGEGQLFSIDLVDSSGEIRATLFRNLVDKYYDMIEVNKVYYLTKCQLKPANKRFSNIKNDYELTFNDQTVLQECMEEDDSTPAIQYNFIEIAKIADLKENEIIDVIGVCKECSDVVSFKAKSSGRELKKRDVTLVDTSNMSIGLTLWGDEATKFDGQYNPVVLIKGANIKEFNGSKTISPAMGSVVKINPDIDEAFRLRGWYNNGGDANIVGNISARSGKGFGGDTPYADIAKSKEMGMGDKPDYYQCKTTVLFAKTANAVYKACPQSDCNKKVIDQGDNTYRCEKCNMEFPNFKYRLLLNINVGDSTSDCWITCFGEQAELLLEKGSQEIGEIFANDPEEGKQFFAKVHFKEFIMKNRVKCDRSGETMRSQQTLISATPVDYEAYNKHLIEAITRLRLA